MSIEEDRAAAIERRCFALHDAMDMIGDDLHLLRAALTYIRKTCNGGLSDQMQGVRCLEQWREEGVDAVLCLVDAKLCDIADGALADGQATIQDIRQLTRQAHQGCVVQLRPVASGDRKPEAGPE